MRLACDTGGTFTDLVVERGDEIRQFKSSTVPADPVQGDNVTIHATILNNGALEANDVAVQFVDVTNGDSVPIGGRQTIASIAAGSSGTVETTYDTTMRPGDRRIQVVVDPVRNAFGVGI